MTRPPDDETLIAYADGELDAEVALRMERELDRNPALAGRVSGYQADAALLRAALQCALYASPRDLPSLDGGNATAPRRRHLLARLGASNAVAWALAASMAAFGLGMSMDRLLVEPAVFPDKGQHAGPGAVRYSENMLEASLERSMSGVSTAWRDPDSGVSGEVIPVRTFKTADGRYCREYREIRWLSAGREETGGIACRQAAGGWKVRIRYYPD